MCSHSLLELVASCQQNCCNEIKLTSLLQLVDMLPVGMTTCEKSVAFLSILPHNSVAGTTAEPFGQYGV